MNIAAYGDLCVREDLETRIHKSQETRDLFLSALLGGDIIRLCYGDSGARDIYICSLRYGDRVLIDLFREESISRSRVFLYVCV